MNEPINRAKPTSESGDVNTKDSPFGSEYEDRIVEINLKTALANARLGQEKSGFCLYCSSVGDFQSSIYATMIHLSIPRNNGLLNTPGHHYDVDDHTLSICGNDAVKSIIAAGHRFPGIDFVADTLKVAIPSEARFAARNQK